MKYIDNQKEIQKSYFNESKLGGKYNRKNYDYILIDEKDNFISQDVYNDAVKYFKDIEKNNYNNEV